MPDRLRRIGCECLPGDMPLTANNLEGVAALIIPPPVGIFEQLSAFGGEWRRDESSLLTRNEIAGILSYLNDGGRLFAVSFRFGDSFAKSNLSQLSASLGWLLTDDAVIDLEVAGKRHPLHTTFETSSSDIVASWAARGISSVKWRPVTTFSALPNLRGEAVVYPPKTCAYFDSSNHNIVHQRRPICVSGEYGDGRYVLLGGPHVVEQSDMGFLSLPDNSRFLSNLLEWLFQSEAANSAPEPTEEDRTASQQPTQATTDTAQAKMLWQRVCSSGGSTAGQKGETFVDFLACFLADTEILAPLGRSVWASDRESEIDLVYECTCNKPLWSGSRGIVPVECKNWKSRVGAPEVTRFAEKVDRTASRIGLFAAREYTEAAWAAAAKARLRHDTVIGLLGDRDFSSYLAGTATAARVVEASLVRSILL